MKPKVKKETKQNSIIKLQQKKTHYNNNNMCENHSKRCPRLRIIYAKLQKEITAKARIRIFYTKLQKEIAVKEV